MKIIGFPVMRAGSSFRFPSASENRKTGKASILLRLMFHLITKKKKTPGTNSLNIFRSNFLKIKLLKWFFLLQKF